MAYMLYAACGSNVGRLRGSNEDNFCFDGGCKAEALSGLEVPLRLDRPLVGTDCFAVFDGMGGESFGEAAAYAAAEALCACIGAGKTAAFDSEARLEELTAALNLAVVEKKRELLADHMGTTLAMLCLSGTRAWACNLGDSRVYLFRDGELRQLSRDHVRRTRSQDREKPPLNQYLGIDPKELRIVPTITAEELHLEDIFLLCSDGLTDMLSEEELKGILGRCSSAAACTEQLIAAALEKGGRDNVTVILCRIL